MIRLSLPLKVLVVLLEAIHCGKLLASLWFGLFGEREM